MGVHFLTTVLPFGLETDLWSFSACDGDRKKMTMKQWRLRAGGGCLNILHASAFCTSWRSVFMKQAALMLLGVCIVAVVGATKSHAQERGFSNHDLVTFAASSTCTDDDLLEEYCTSVNRGETACWTCRSIHSNATALSPHSTDTAQEGVWLSRLNDSSTFIQQTFGQGVNLVQTSLDIYHIPATSLSLSFSRDYGASWSESRLVDQSRTVDLLDHPQSDAEGANIDIFTSKLQVRALVRFVPLYTY